MGRKIVLTSGKGGVGKTSVAANLGISLARLNRRVCLVDADIGLNNLDVVLDLENKIVYDLGDVADKRCGISQAVIQDKNLPFLYVLPSAKATDLSSINQNAFKQIINDLSKNFDFVIIDCPAGIEEGFHRAVDCADEAIVVVTPHISSIRDADKVTSLLSTYKLKVLGIVVNRIRGDMVIEKKMISAEEIANLLRAKLIGVIPEDDKLALYSNIQKGNAYRSFSGNAFSLLAEYVYFNKGKVFDCTLQYKSVINKLFQRVFVKGNVKIEGELWGKKTGQLKGWKKYC